MIFLGTPHSGSDKRCWAGYLEQICYAAVSKQCIDNQPRLFESLERNSETLVNIDRSFAHLIGDIHLFYFHEGQPTDNQGTKTFVGVPATSQMILTKNFQIVDEGSAAPTASNVERAVIQADHLHMCKFEHDSSPGYELISESTQRYAQEAPEHIQAAWAREKKVRQIGIGNMRHFFNSPALLPKSLVFIPFYGGIFTQFDGINSMCFHCGLLNSDRNIVLLC